MKTFVVIGLGRFGSAVAEELCSLGNQVLAIDPDEEAVQRIADKVTQAAVANAQEPDALRTLGVSNFDCAVVAFSNDIGASVLISLNLKDLGIPELICKARNHIHAEVLKRIGADLVVFPEDESGRKLARSIASHDILNYIELSSQYGMTEMFLPESWIDKTLRQLDIRARYHVTVIAVQSREGMMTVSPSAEYVFQRGDLAFVLGDNESIDRLQMVK